VAAWGLTEKPQLPPISAEGRSLESARSGTRAVIFEGASHEAQLFDRERLPPGAVISGPALIEESGSSTVVPPGWTAEVDRIGSIVLRRR
jgi:N-methylhydantoinase A